MNQTAGLFGGLLIGVALLGAYVWDKVSEAGSFAAAFPQIYSALGGTAAAAASSSSSSSAATTPPYGNPATVPASQGGGFGPQAPSSTSDPNAGGFGNVSMNSILGTSAYQFGQSDNGGLQLFTSPDSGIVDLLPGPSPSQYSPPDLADTLFSQGQLA